MAISQALCTSFKSEILDEQHDITSDTIKIALYTSSASLGAATTAYSSSNEISNASGSAYSAGGATLGSAAVATDGTTVTIDFADPTWTSASFTANGALIYNSSNSNKAICVLAFGGDFTVTNGTFQITFPAADASNALIRLA
jgi:hypothetical protein|tara:strand:+ start:58 stop:486 length:429 start_codon:yes stop_codon:yes gene_type:complete